MKYFSGFCFKDEQNLFEEWIEESSFCVAGFSYGAIKAFEYTLLSKDRIDKLQLFSPAFFQDRDEKFKKIQKLFFLKNQEAYIKEFLNNAIHPSKIDIKPYMKTDDSKALALLLDYMWDKAKIKEIVRRGVKIEVYLGEEDRIIHPENALNFFIPYADIYYMKDIGHMLR